MTRLPLENQVCTLEQAKKLAELLGDDAPESLWQWIESTDGWQVYPSKIVLGKEIYNAYTGDELGALLIKCIDFDTIIPLYAQAKADLAIQGLDEGRIKKKEFRYE